MNDEDGFTLIEVLVAATLFALVMMLATEGMRAALSGWHATQRRTAADAEIATAQSLLRRLVGEARPLVVRGRDGKPRLAFHGGSDRLRLVAAVPPGSGLASVVELRLAGNALVAVVAPLDPASRQPFDALERGTATTLVEGIAGGGFSYGGDGGNWSGAWADDARALPAATRLRLSFPPGDVRAWPELVAVSPAEALVVF